LFEFVVSAWTPGLVPGVFPPEGGAAAEATAKVRRGPGLAGCAS
jgi:hypothetical protein